MDASGQSDGLGLNWVRLEGAEQCISSAELMKWLEAKHGNRILFQRAGDAPLSIDGYVRAVEAPQGWAVTLEVSTPDGTVLGRRELKPVPGESCHVIEDEIDLVIGLTLDPDGALGGGIPLSPRAREMLARLFNGESLDSEVVLNAGRVVPPPAPAPAPAPTLDTRKPPAPEKDPPEAAMPKGSVWLDAGGTGLLGQLPGLSFGVSLHAGVMARGWLFELGVLVAPPSTESAALGQAALDLELASIAACPVQLFSTVLALCGGAEAGRQGIRPSEFRQTYAPSSHAAIDGLLAGTARLNLAGPLFGRAALMLVVPFVRSDYVFETSTGMRRLFRAAAVTGRLELGLGARL